MLVGTAIFEARISHDAGCSLAEVESMASETRARIRLQRNAEASADSGSDGSQAGQFTMVWLAPAGSCLSLQHKQVKRPARRLSLSSAPLSSESGGKEQEKLASPPLLLHLSWPMKTLQLLLWSCLMLSRSCHLHVSRGTENPRTVAAGAGATTTTMGELRLIDAR